MFRSGSHSVGCLLIVPKSMVSKRIGVANTLLFVTTPGAIMLFALLLWLTFATRDIEMAPDMETVIADDERLGAVEEKRRSNAQNRQTREEISEDRKYHKELNRASRESINRFMMSMGGHSNSVHVVSPAALQGIPVDKEKTQTKQETIVSP